MRRSPRSVLTAAVAVVVAVLTAWTVGSDVAALHRRARDLGAPRPVVVADRDVPLGAMLRARDLRTVTRHASTVPAGTLDDPSDAIGRVVAVPLLAGAFVTDRHLAAADRSGVDGLVAPGTRAVNVRTDDGLRPRPGSVVDVLATVDPGLTGGTGIGADGAVTVASAALVLAVDDGGDPADDPYAAGGAGGVTLLVTEREARTLAFAAANGVLMLALAPPEDACCPPPAP